MNRPVTVTRILRFGSSYTVKLACGCSFNLTRDELMDRQLFPGARLAHTCPKKQPAKH